MSIGAGPICYRVLLLLKLVLVPSLVAAVTLASRRWGLRVGGVLTALPMVAGPTLIFYAIEQGDAFAADAARTAMLGIAATAAFCVAYARTAAHTNWMASLAAGWAALAVIAAALYRLPDLRGAGELTTAVAALLIGRRLIPARPSKTGSPSPPPWDIPLRMVTAAVAVVAFTGLAAVLGPRLSGVVSAFPVVTMILAVFTHAQRGGAPVATFLRGLLRGLHSFAVLCLVFSVTLGPLGWPLPAAFSTALAAQLALQAVILHCSAGQPP